MSREHALQFGAEWFAAMESQQRLVALRRGELIDVRADRLTELMQNPSSCFAAARGVFSLPLVPLSDDEDPTSGIQCDNAATMDSDDEVDVLSLYATADEDFPSFVAQFATAHALPTSALTERAPSGMASSADEVLYLLPSTCVTSHTTFQRQLLRARQLLGVNDASSNILIVENQANALQSVVQEWTPPKSIIVFGICTAQQRGEILASLRLLPCVSRAVLTMSSAGHGVSLECMDGRSVRVLFAPEPSTAWTNFDALLHTVAAAHAISVPSANLLARLQRRLCVPLDCIVLESESVAPYVAIQVDSSEQRFVLADGVLTHNSQWEARISREFSAQAARETALGLPVAPFMRGLDSLQTRAKLQVNFIEFVLMPWWRSAARLLSPALDPCLRLLQQNKEYFERLSAVPPGNNPHQAMVAAAEAPIIAELKQPIVLPSQHNQHHGHAQKNNHAATAPAPVVGPQPAATSPTAAGAAASAAASPTSSGSAASASPVSPTSPGTGAAPSPATPRVSNNNSNASTAPSTPLNPALASPRAAAGVPKALRLLGITALPVAVGQTTPGTAATSGSGGGGAGSALNSPVSSHRSSGHGLPPTSPAVATPGGSTLSSPRSSPLAAPVTASAPGSVSLPPSAMSLSLADAASKSQLHAPITSPSSAKGTPVQTASSVLKSVPLLSSHNPARNSGHNHHHLMSPLSLSHAPAAGTGPGAAGSAAGGDSPGTRARKRAGTEVVRPLVGVASGRRGAVGGSAQALSAGGRHVRTTGGGGSLDSTGSNGSGGGGSGGGSGAGSGSHPPPSEEGTAAAAHASAPAASAAPADN
jgi:hypothetical protein